MPHQSYQTNIYDLLRRLPYPVDLDVRIDGRPPTMASSEFLTNKEQGDWAEQVVLTAINDCSKEFSAYRYGRADSLAAGDPGFPAFYQSYQEELNTIGKRPDILIFRRSEFEDDAPNLQDEATVAQAVAAIEVRSSSFLAAKYKDYMDNRSAEAHRQIRSSINEILRPPYRELLRSKRPVILNLLESASDETFRELDFRYHPWSSSSDLTVLSCKLRDIKNNIEILHKRDFLSVTPKLEDLALVNRWIQRFGVRHFYLQVFFDKGYIIPFQRILELVSDANMEDAEFSVEKDVKNQGKTTLKVNVQVCSEVIGRIDMPEHYSALKELDRGRLLFYVKFRGGRGYLDPDVLHSVISHA